MSSRVARPFHNNNHNSMISSGCQYSCHSNASNIYLESPL